MRFARPPRTRKAPSEAEKSHQRAQGRVGPILRLSRPYRKREAATFRGALPCPILWTLYEQEQQRICMQALELVAHAADGIQMFVRVRLQISTHRENFFGAIPGTATIRHYPRTASSLASGTLRHSIKYSPPGACFPLAFSKVVSRPAFEIWRTSKPKPLGHGINSAAPVSLIKSP